MEISKLFGLPAHPLLVHIPIVLLPLVAIGTLAIAVVPAWRRRFGWVVVGMAVAALVGVQLALGSGEALEPHVERNAVLHRHTELASSLRPMALVLLVLVLALVLIDRRSVGPRWLVPVVAVLAVLSGGVTTYRLAEVGHNGAKASWGDLNMSARPNGGNGG
ncbi:MAG: hypothetical protein JWN29_3570 [Acidimicrobiales bacterium]|jgi:uncharacterized membrane protein|nr:hypothetical protein [Acidimicrobiales bacterium]